MRCGTAAEQKLTATLDELGLDYELNPGDGAFYGPKIDMHMTDSLGRSWQLGTVQLDYSMPERFSLSYTGADNQEHVPVMIHRAHVRLLRALHRHHDRALRRRAAAVARARAGHRAARIRPLQRLRRHGQRHARRPGRARGAGRSQRVASGERSARPSCERSRTCWWLASASRASRRCPCASTAAVTPAACRSRSSQSRLAGRAILAALKPAKSSERHA